jgi:hypothetical protein
MGRDWSRSTLDAEDILDTVNCTPEDYSTSEAFNQAGSNIIYLSEQFLGDSLYPFEDAYSGGPRDISLTRQLRDYDGDHQADIPSRYEEEVEAFAHFVEAWVPNAWKDEEYHLDWLEHAAAAVHEQQHRERMASAAHSSSLQKQIETLVTGFDPRTWKEVERALTKEQLL